MFCKDLRIDGDFCFIHRQMLVFITVVKSVYCAVRTDSLYTADCASSLKGQRPQAEILELLHPAVKFFICFDLFILQNLISSLPRQPGPTIVKYKLCIIL